MKQLRTRVYQKFTLETRQPKVYPRVEAAVTQEMKDYGISRDAVDHWNQLAVTAPDHVKAVVRSAVGVATPTARPVETYQWSATTIVEDVADRRAVFTERDLLPEVAGFLPEGATRTELVDSARRVLENGLESGRILRVVPERGSGLRLPDGTRLSDDELSGVQSLTPRIDVSDPGSDVLSGEGRYTTYLQLHREQRVLDSVASSSPVAMDRGVLEAAMATRVALGPDRDLTDLSAPEARLWQTTVDAYHPHPEPEGAPRLRMVG